ncbi:MAG TPA: histidine kinase [Gemmatimonadaceae bacterium]|nr:histidine kinase [Gemmatimonadaceae bacterium]
MRLTPRHAHFRLPLLIAIWAVPALIAGLQSYAVYTLNDEWPRNWPFILVQVGAWLTWVPLTPLLFALARRWPLDPHAGAGGEVASDDPVAAVAPPAHRLRRALLRHGAAALGITIAHAFLWSEVSLLVQMRIEPATLARHPASSIYTVSVLARLVTGLLTYGAIVAAATTIDSLGRLRAQELRAARLASELTAAQLGALKMQLHPHFLFNTLHAITVLIREDPPAATRTVTRLGELLRLTLSRARHTEVALAHELELVRLYLEIEGTRFQDRLVVTYDVAPETLRARVPDLVLQPLVENAIRHGIAPRAAAGRVVVHARRDDGTLVIEVRDDGPGPGRAPSGPGGIGLSTTRERLRTLYGASHALELLEAPGGGCIARLVVPFQSAHDAGDDIGDAIHVHA